MSEELKPCPFCGGEVSVVVLDEEGNVRDEEYERDPYSGLSYAVAHDDPNGACPIATYDAPLPWFYDSRDSVAHVWNRRAGRTCRMEAFLLGEFFTGRKHVTDTELSDEDIDKVLLELRDDTVIRCSACHFSVLYGADVTYTQTDDGAWSVDAVRSQINYCPHCGAKIEVDDDF